MTYRLARRALEAASTFRVGPRFGAKASTPLPIVLTRGGGFRPRGACSRKAVEADTRARHRTEEKIADARLRLIREFERIAYSDTRDVVQWDLEPELDQDGNVVGFKDVAAGVRDREGGPRPRGERMPAAAERAYPNRRAGRPSQLTCQTRSTPAK